MQKIKTFYKNQQFTQSCKIMLSPSLSLQTVRINLISIYGESVSSEVIIYVQFIAVNNGNDGTNPLSHGKQIELIVFSDGAAHLTIRSLTISNMQQICSGRLKK